ncbi:hypothetical protein FRACYDRAFT_234725 [Fragilariopsis cylindrus CCMP1102]|uniref:Uncharacterized protein n=1 Tax=Fragilariopsis cylindrus CCMP1102 TaxID=635003 RepID=A0A1E7FSF5_9STRA|nr:hypothetical protein FRACYDRAFT_234725 [Fragilariopsis cylindrus CCMP1102]|eukprot:OEU21099.1 hypothetical protein FRACYDRAFT_234725 [Fragilariopsis cylindrus CCMP1102]
MAQSNNNSSCYCGSTCNNTSTAIEDSRDVLKAMILQESRNYRCPNYLYHSNNNNNNNSTTWGNKNETATNDNKHNNNSDGNGNESTTSFIQPQSPSPSSSWEMIEEIANLVTDVRFIVHHNNNDYCSSNNNKNNNKNKDGEDKNQRKGKKCTSPVSSSDNLYEDKTTTTTTTTTISSHSISTDDTQQQQKQQEQQQSPHDYYCFSSSRQRNNCHRHRQLSCHETLCLSSWRHQMFDWACAVRDNERFFDVNNIVLEVAFNILDRYVAVELYNNNNDDAHDALRITREDFQLFAMVSIYIARYFTENDITTTERDILSALNWHVNPPTVIDYCDIYLNLFPLHQEETKKRKEIVQCKCKYITTEIVLDDDFFLDKPHSVIALAVVLLATDASRSGNGIGDDGNDGIGSSDIALQTFLRNIQGVVNVYELEFDSIIRRLECSC